MSGELNQNQKRPLPESTSTSTLNETLPLASTSTSTDTTSITDTATPAKRSKPAPSAAATAAEVVASSDPFGAGETDSPSIRPDLSANAQRGRDKTRGGRGGGGDRKNGGGGGRGGKNSGGRDHRDGRDGKGKNKEWNNKRDENDTRATPGGGEEGEEGGEKADRLPKKKVAVLIGYNGIGYSGSQINPGVETIEGEVFKAFVAAGVISADNSTHPQKVGLSRAARTDAGVHAAVNVLTLKLILNPPSLPTDSTLEAYLNTFLPKTVRVWNIIRVQGGFSPRTNCDQRHYEYIVPTHVFLGPKPGTAMEIAMKKSRSKSNAAAATGGVASEEPVTPPTLSEFEVAAAEATALSDAFWATQPSETNFVEDLKAKRAWRISPGLVKSLRTFVKAYEGSHNYYNFTVKKEFRDRSNQRIMRKLEVSEPFLVNELEYVSVSFLGQSFMLHQIRKMIGLTILAVRTATPPSLIPETFGPSRIHIPKAPALGLLLLEPQYQEYNKRINEANSKFDSLVQNGRLDRIDAEEQKREIVSVGKEATKLAIEEFKTVEIFSRMWEVEQAEGVFTKWLNFLDVYHGPDFEYLNPQGIIPPSAVFKKGENNEKPRAQGQETSTSSNATTTTTGGEKATTTGGIDVEDMAAPSDDEEDLKGGEEMEG